MKEQKAMEFAKTALFLGADDSYSQYHEGGSFFMPGKDRKCMKYGE